MKKNFLIAVFLVAGYFGYSQNQVSQMISIAGNVKDEKGNPIASASVSVKETNSGISTDNLGAFKLSVKPDAILIVSGLGFETDTIPVNSQVNFDIVLKSKSKSLKEVEVVSKSNQQNGVKRDEQTDYVVIQNMLDNFVSSQNMNVGGLNLSHESTINLGQSTAVPIGSTITKFSTVPSGTLYTGAAIPVFQHKEETKGSRYFFAKWVTGSVVDTGNNIIDNKKYSFNYDKIANSLLIFRDASSVIEVNKEQVKAFVLKDGDQLYFFEKSAFDHTRFSLALVRSQNKYSFYKSIRTKFKKADYRSDGLTESGNPYDEYVDDITYVVVKPGGKEFMPIQFKKKMIKDLFSADASKVNAYFSKHEDENIDETFVTGLVSFKSIIF